ncbi:MAG: LytTR family DNA-binding domain-containing protein [Butyrivibrio sp.]|nr:LytTR family DNA-binding domain-containing protein [Muribaculum sp.]MCM1551423.1 LytTR family DNA-binding domain-containing protein [Butyrivibrio sp.]
MITEGKGKLLIAVCDACNESRQRVRGLIEDYGRDREQDIEVEEYSSGAALCGDIIHVKELDIIFLDMNMNEADGLQAAKRINDIYPDIPIVLVASLLSYALEGYRVNAARFLVKDNLESTIAECLDDLRDKLRRKNQKAVFAFVEGTRELEIQKIVYIETNRHRNIFHTSEADYRLYKKLNEIEEELAPYGFVRVHQSYLVNMRYVDRISSYLMRLTTGKEISVPKSRYPRVKELYALYKESNA